MIKVAQKSGKNKDLLAIENIDKIAIVKVAKVSNAINLYNKRSLAISNANMNIAQNLKSIDIKKYQRYIDQS